MLNSVEQMELFIGGMSGESTSEIIERQEKRGQQALQRSERLPLNVNKHSGIVDPSYAETLTAMGIEIGEKIDDLFMSVKLPNGWRIQATDHSMWSNLVDEKGRNRASIFYKAAFYDRDAFLNFNRRFSISYMIPDYDVKLYEHKPEYIVDGYEEVWVDEDGNETASLNIRADMWYYEERYFGNRKRNRGKSFSTVKKPIYKKNPDYVALTGYEKYSQPFHFEVHDHDGSILFSSDVVKTDYDYSKDRHVEFFEHKEQVEETAKQQCFDWLKQNYPNWKNNLAYWA